MGGRRLANRRRPRTRKGQDPNAPGLPPGVQRTGVTFYPDEFRMLDAIAKVFYGTTDGKRSETLRDLVEEKYLYLVRAGEIPRDDQIDPERRTAAAIAPSAPP